MDRANDAFSDITDRTIREDDFQISVKNRIVRGAGYKQGENRVAYEFHC